MRDVARDVVGTYDGVDIGITAETGDGRRATTHYRRNEQ